MLGYLPLSGLLLVYALGASCGGQPNSSEPKLFVRIDAALGSTPPTAKDIVSAFGLPEGCTRKSCILPAGKVDGVVYSGISLRPVSQGLIFEISDLGGSCVPTALVRMRYGASAAEQVCYDAPCWYSTARRPWGFLAFQLKSPTAKCVSSVVINTLPEQR